MRVVLLGRFAVSGRDYVPHMVTTPWDIRVHTEDAPREQIAESLSGADAVITMVWNAQRPPVPKLKLFQVCAAGLDRVEIPTLPKGLTICNAFGHEEAMGEYALMGMLTFTHHLMPTDASFRSGSWALSQEKGEFPPHGEVGGKTVLIIGTGKLGRAVAERCKAIGARIIGVNRSPITDPIYEERYGLDKLDEALSKADFAVVCIGLTPDTRGLVGEKQLAAMKKTGVILNLARGPVIAEEPLYRALADKRIAGAIIDTWYRYPGPDDPSPRPSAFPFHELQNVIMTPHTSAWTTGMLDRRWRQISGNLDRFARGEPLINKVMET